MSSTAPQAIRFMPFMSEVTRKKAFPSPVTIALPFGSDRRTSTVLVPKFDPARASGVIAVVVDVPALTLPALPVERVAADPKPSVVLAAAASASSSRVSA